MPPVVGLLNLYAGGVPLLKGHAAPVIFIVAVCIAAVIVWLPFVSGAHLLPLGNVALSLLAMAWLYQLILERAEGNSLDFGVIAPFVLIVLTVLKPPSLPQVLRAAQAFAGAVVIVALVTLLMGAFTDFPSGFGIEGGGQRLSALSNLGLEWRWFGPFIHSNLAGPVGGAVVIIGLASKNRVRVGLIAGGALILFLSQSRTGFSALLLALALWWFARCWLRKGRIEATSWAPLIATTATISGYILLQDPTLAGRTPAWSDYFDLMMSAPLFGVGNTGVRDYLEDNSERVIDFAQPHAHNLLLDFGGRWGAPMLMLSATIIILSIVIGLRAAKRGLLPGLILSAFVILVGVAETPFTWSHASPLMMTFFLAILLSSSAGKFTHGRGELLADSSTNSS